MFSRTVISLAAGCLLASVGSCTQHECDAEPEKCQYSMNVESPGQLTLAGGGTLKLDVMRGSEHADFSGLQLSQTGKNAKPLTVMLPAPLPVEFTLPIPIKAADLMGFSIGEASLDASIGTSKFSNKISIVYRTLDFDSQNVTTYTETNGSTPMPTWVGIWTDGSIYTLQYEDKSATRNYHLKKFSYQNSNHQLSLVTTNPDNFIGETWSDFDYSFSAISVPSVDSINNPTQLNISKCPVVLGPCNSTTAYIKPNGLLSYRKDRRNKYDAVIYSNGMVAPFNTSIHTINDLPNPLPKAIQMALGDLNPETDLSTDLLIAYENNSIGVVTYDGMNFTYNKSITDQLQQLVGSSTLGSLALGDIDGDGLDDIVIARGSQINFILNQRGGNFRSDPLQLSLPQVVNSLAIGDVNGDKMNDIVAINTNGKSIMVITQK